ncbi:BTB/POZ and MATH domain-containing protein 1-like [Typha angustifolia]|uniref:BTB/POZ and MATH domain-containing protein 1-like n=1 Tax=Typha angustifolia TaxID=59011 RepID=UPI003C2E4165
MIYYFPDGRREQDEGAYISLVLSLVSAATDVRAMFTFTLLDRSGNPMHVQQKRVVHNFRWKGFQWGYMRFISKTDLEKSDYLYEDCLTIKCEIDVITACRTEPNSPPWCPFEVPPPNLHQDIGKLLNTGEGADVAFKVDGQVFLAHRLVLASRSRVFSAELLGEMKEGQNCVPIDDMDESQNKMQMPCITIEDMEAEVFKALLHFAYQDSLPDMEELTPAQSVVLAQHLLVAADRYDFERLKLICERKLIKDVEIDTVATTLALAEQHRRPHLKAVCLDFAAASRENLIGMVLTSGFEHLIESCPSVVKELQDKVCFHSNLKELLGKLSDSRKRRKFAVNE